jgi:hypothetical protein
VENTTLSNDERAIAVEKILLQEAVSAGVVNEIKITVPKNPISGERPLHRGLTRHVGKQKGIWQGHDRNMLRGIHTAQYISEHILRYANRHVWSLLLRLQTCLIIIPHVFGVCLGVKITWKIV